MIDSAGTNFFATLVLFMNYLPEIGIQIILFMQFCGEE